MRKFMVTAAAAVYATAGAASDFEVTDPRSADSAYDLSVVVGQIFCPDAVVTRQEFEDAVRRQAEDEEEANLLYDDAEDVWASWGADARFFLCEFGPGEFVNLMAEEGWVED